MQLAHAGGHQHVSLLPGAGERMGRVGGLGDLQIALPTSLLISKVAVIRSSCWGRRWEGVKSYARSYKQCVPINQIKAERVYFQKVCFLRRARRQRAFGGRGEGEGGKIRGRARGGERTALAMLTSAGGWHGRGDAGGCLGMLSCSWLQLDPTGLVCTSGVERGGGGSLEPSHSIPGAAVPQGARRDLVPPMAARAGLLPAWST